MTREKLCAKIDEAIDAIDFRGTFMRYDDFGNGHINDTFITFFKQEDGSEKKYILQRMNHEVFRNPEQLMKNIVGITNHLRNKIIENGGDPFRESMNIVYTKNGESYFKDSLGSFWRAYLFITDATSYEQVREPEHFYQSAVTFGHFQNLLSDYDANSLYETIPGFHNTPERFETFKKTVKEDICGRVKNVKPEIEFFMNHEIDMYVCAQMQKDGKLPLRVTHNDTKLNNIMIDNITEKGICVLDLDTVMPGLSIFDFGDSIRFGANTALEDEKDLSKVTLSLELFDLYTKGFLEGCNGSLTENEIDMLPMGAKVMTLECGMRFLADYLSGDTYFNIKRPEHNLDRCRTQIKLVEEMELKWEEMKKIVDNYR